MMTVDLRTFDVGSDVASPADYADLMISRVVESWDEGADIVLFPEFAWMGLAKFVDQRSCLREVARLFWDTLWPVLTEQLKQKDRMAVLGTVPFLSEDGRIYNRAPIVLGNSWGAQDKLNLTPWESALAAGDVLTIWEFAGLRIAVVICLDIEVPELSVMLRGRGVDLILVPSATETVLGMERVGRCASARSVELGCYVGVAHLVGCGATDLIDENVGRLAWFAPSQSAFSSEGREVCTAVASSGFQMLRASLDVGKLRGCRELISETNPSLLTVSSNGVELRYC
jgi:predicted amidohydrolase